MTPERIRDEALHTILDMRLRRPERITELARTRIRPARAPGTRHLVIAADHPARGALRAGTRPLAMGDRLDLLDRLRVALSRPGVTGFLGTADLIEDLLILGALDGKSVFGSMNRGGLAGSAFEMDDRFTGYNADTIAELGFEGGKMLLRVDPEDPATVATMESCSRAVTELARHRRIAMVEPFISRRVEGRVRNDLTAEAVMRSIAIASGLGATSAYTWLKLPVIADPADMERALSASTLPSLLLGGEVPDDPDESFDQWSRAVRLPTVQGLIVGRSLLYPADDDVKGAVDTAAALL